MAHLTLKISLIAGLLCSLSAQAAHCQAYNYRSGNARVVQGAGGLPNPSASYITGGTLSRSAQAGAGLSTYSNLQNGASTSGVSGAGLTPGISGNANLPMARMGSTVGMPGDYMRSDLNPNFNLQQQPRQSVQYRNQRGTYQQPQTNQVATYGRPYTRYGSNPTGRQATQVATPTGGQKQASTAASSAAGSSSGGEFKGY